MEPHTLPPRPQTRAKIWEKLKTAASSEVLLFWRPVSAPHRTRRSPGHLGGPQLNAPTCPASGRHSESQGLTPTSQSRADIPAGDGNRGSQARRQGGGHVHGTARPPSLADGRGHSPRRASTPPPGTERPTCGHWRAQSVPHWPWGWERHSGGGSTAQRAAQWASPAPASLGHPVHPWLCLPHVGPPLPLWGFLRRVRAAVRAACQALPLGVSEGVSRGEGPHRGARSRWPSAEWAPQPDPTPGRAQRPQDPSGGRGGRVCRTGARTQAPALTDTTLLSPDPQAWAEQPPASAGPLQTQTVRRPDPRSPSHLHMPICPSGCVSAEHG